MGKGRRDFISECSKGSPQWALESCWAQPLPLPVHSEPVAPGARSLGPSRSQCSPGQRWLAKRFCLTYSWLLFFFVKEIKSFFFFHKNSDFELLWKVLTGVSIGPCLWCQGVNGCVGGWAHFRVSLSPSATWSACPSTCSGASESLY